MLAALQSHARERHAHEAPGNAVVVAELERAPAELGVPEDAVQQVLDRYQAGGSDAWVPGARSLAAPSARKGLASGCRGLVRDVHQTGIFRRSPALPFDVRQSDFPRPREHFKKGVQRANAQEVQMTIGRLCTRHAVTVDPEATPGLARRTEDPLRDEFVT